MKVSHTRRPTRSMSTDVTVLRFLWQYHRPRIIHRLLEDCLRTGLIAIIAALMAVSPPPPTHLLTTDSSTVEQVFLQSSGQTAITIIPVPATRMFVCISPCHALRRQLVAERD